MYLVDSRVGSKDLAPQLQGAELCTLEYADVALTGMVNNLPVFIGIEVKTLGDVLSCMRNGRFAGHQLPGLLKDYDYTYLIIQGVYRAGKDGLLQIPKGKTVSIEGERGWKTYDYGATIAWKDLEGWITTMETKTPLNIRRTSNRAETVEIIKSLHTWWVHKDWDKHRSHLDFDRSATPVGLRKPSLLRRIVKELPGVGWDRSQKVEKHFGSVLAMVLAKPEEWRKVEGIGKTLASKIVKGMIRRK